MSMFGGLKSVANEMFYKIKDFIDENFNKAATNFAGVEPPVSPSVGMIWEDTSTTPSMTKKYNSAGVWQKVLLISYIQSTAPANPLHYEYWIDTGGNKSILKKWNGEEWEEIETLGQIEIDNIDGIEIAEYEELNEGDVLVYLSDGKLHFQTPPAAAGANATHLNSAEIDDSAKSGESDGYILKFNKTSLKYILSENVASKLNDGASGKTYNDIVTAISGVIGTHTADASAHHAKYTDAEARAAMGAKANGNPLNHDRYSNSEAVAAMGEKINANPLNHDRYTDTEAKNALANFIAPVGSIVAWAKNIKEGLTIPSGWVECSGQTLSDAESVLNGIVIPNLNGQNRFLRGNATTGGTGGAETHTLTVDEMPSHKHSLNANVVTETGTGSIGGVDQSGNAYITETQNAGGGQPHENRPPFYNVVWIMRVK